MHPTTDTSPDVSRETPPHSTLPSGSPLGTVTRASDLVSERNGDHPLGGDRSTPLARATEHSIAVATGRPLRRQLPRPEQPRVMVVANQKGGVGKTTTTVNVAAALAQHGLKVLVIDLDPQGNASTALSVEHGAGIPGSYQVLVEATPMDEVIVECPDVPGLFVVPATIDLAGAEIELVSLVARETRLKKALDAHLAECAEVDATYDYVFIDCPPSLGLLTVNALSAGLEMLIPIQCEYYALEGLSQLLHTIEQIREHLNPRLKVGAIMLTMYDARTRLAAGVADEVREHFGEVVLGTAIPRSVRHLGSAELWPDGADLRPRLGWGPLVSRGGQRARPPGLRCILPARPSHRDRREGRPMSTPRRGLGRGLGSLIPTGPGKTSVLDDRGPNERTGPQPQAGRPTTSAAPDALDGEHGTPTPPNDLTSVAGAYFAELAPTAIDPNPRQPRSVFDEEAMAELTHSIREVGLLQPIVVRPLGDDRYELIMGERRWRAAQQAGLDAIPAIVRETKDDDLLRDALLENLHRAQLNPLEEAAAYQQMLDDFGCTHEDLATRIGRSRPQISNTLRLLKLSVPVQRRVAAGVLSAGHARALLAVDDATRQDALASRVVSEGISVRGLEELVAVGDDAASATRAPKQRLSAPGLTEIADRLGSRFETRCKVTLGRSKGRITVEFASLDDLQRILSLMDPEGA